MMWQLHNCNSCNSLVYIVLYSKVQLVINALTIKMREASKKYECSFAKPTFTLATKTHCEKPLLWHIIGTYFSSYWCSGRRDMCVGQHLVIKGGQLSETIKTLEFYFNCKNTLWKAFIVTLLLGHIFLSIGALVGEICVGQHLVIKEGQLSEAIKVLDFYNPGCPLIP